MQDKFRLFSILLIMLIAMSLNMGHAGMVQADEDADFLRSLAGKFSGSGRAQIAGHDPVKVSCRITNKVDGSGTRLSLAGRCASTKGKRLIRGSLQINGTKVSGNFIAPWSGARVLSSSGRVKGKTLTLNATIAHVKAKQPIKTRQIVRLTGKGMAATFYHYDPVKRRYVNIGRISFSKR